MERDRLVKFFDTSVAIQDDVLLEVLGQDETNEMKAITATIQSEQNTIIRDVKSQNILVNGVAGMVKPLLSCSVFRICSIYIEIR